MSGKFKYCAVIVCDILVWGSAVEEHDRNLKRCNSRQFIPDRIEVGLEEVHYIWSYEKKCNVCLKHTGSNPKEPFISYEIR